MTTVDLLLTDALRDRYMIERELGRGGMATVYLARDVRHKRLVALKVLHPELAHTLGPERFQREIEVAARLPDHAQTTLLKPGGGAQPSTKDTRLRVLPAKHVEFTPQVAGIGCAILKRGEDRARGRLPYVGSGQGVTGRHGPGET